MARRVSKKGKPKSLKQFYRRSVLTNGTVVITERAESFRSLAIGVFVKGGSRHETPKQAGLAHFLEHMMFKGTDKRTSFQIARDVDLVGGDFNAMTTREYTAFHISLPSRSVDFALELLSDIIKHSRFDPVEIERERQVILQEFAMTEEDPEEYVHDILFEKVYGSHPLGRNILGSESTVKNFTRNDVLEYFHRHYYSGNIVITMAGDVDHDLVVRQLNALLGDFKGKRRALSKAALRKPKFVPGIHIQRSETEQVHLVVACESYPIAHEQRIAAFLLNAYLGGNMSSSLFQLIREQKGYAYTVYSSLAPFRDSGIMAMYVATSTKNAGDSLRLIWQETQRLCQQPLRDEELQVAKSSVMSSVELGSDSMETRMFALAKSELFYDQQVSDRDICAMIDKVTPLDVWRAARDLFSPDRWMVVGLGDLKKAVVKKNFPSANF